MTNKSLKALQQDSYLGSGNEAYLENLYEIYLTQPETLSPEWHHYFEQLNQQIKRSKPDIPPTLFQEQFLEHLKTFSTLASIPDATPEKLTELIAAYRRLGHLQAKIDPLNFYQGIYAPALELNYYGFTDADLTKTFSIKSFSGLGPKASLSDIYQTLRQLYCGSIGFEYSHINRFEEVEWLRKQIEEKYINYKPTEKEKLRLLDRLIAADELEKYLGFKYVGQKRFSLEGGDALIPLLDTIIHRSAAQSVKEIVIGMAHRGRLNVLMNIVGKEPKAIFAAFEGAGISTAQSGDVKYHWGYSSNLQTSHGSIHLALAFNPSHLEIVAPVVQGSARSRQRRRRDTEQLQVLPIQIHGDAAFSGQGVVMETFSMSQARWFKVGGSIHIVINNQVGFTTSNPSDARSTLYCTDVAKMVEAPILHVNGNDVEAVCFAAQLAIDYRQLFKRDIVIDLVCYRRHGHNEADEPSATQPLMYKVIKKMPSPYQLYATQLHQEGVLASGAEKKLVKTYRDALDTGKPVVEVFKDDSIYEFSVKWKAFKEKTWDQKIKTSIPLNEIKALAEKLNELPEGFVVQAQVKKTLDARKEMAKGALPINWGFAETLAYASLLEQGYPIRLCGQDAGRGTFAHRHAVLHDQNTDATYIPLSHISDKQVQINIVDSLLSEEAVLAFEYGYAVAEPDNLVLWEAQFGDFANGAQVVFDQFLSSGEQKWGRLCGLVILLPHGYEGQGPEHSSARLERFLQLCAQENMQVCIPSTPAQIFHLLRRQMLRSYRKPLIVMTPKSLLRNPLAASNLSELAENEFQVVIPEVEKLEPTKVERVILCSGKIYYELLEARRKQELPVAIIRIEQLYPFPAEACAQALKAYAHAKTIVWCQEEPKNQGAWFAIRDYLRDQLVKDQQLIYAGRTASASPAAGYHAVHVNEQNELVTQALLK